MELDRFSRIFRNAEIGSKPGLYVVKQDGLPGRYKRVYRCGAAGIRSSGDGLGTLASRMRTYHDYFANGGKVYAVMTIPRAIYTGYVREDLRVTLRLVGRVRCRTGRRGFTRSSESVGCMCWRVGVRRVNIMKVACERFWRLCVACG